MARTKLSLRNSGPSAEYLAYNLGRRLGTKMYGATKKFFQRRRQALRGTQRGGPTQVPTNMGRRMIKIPYNMPRKLKKGLKHCSSLTKKKIELFKDALVKKVNRIYFYRGNYRATEKLKADDNANYQTFAGVKTFPAAGVYGGALGFGRRLERYDNLTDAMTNFGLTPGNALAICLDMPTGYFLPQVFISDVREQGFNPNQRRTFGMLPTGQWDQKVLTALNDGEFTNLNAAAETILEPANATNKINYQKIYTLSYTYRITFKQNLGPEMVCWAIVFKLGNSKASDFVAGLSNYINQQITSDPQGTHKRLLRGDMPPCFKVVKKRSVTVRDNVNQQQPYFNGYGAAEKKGTLTIKSNKSYLSCATRPATSQSSAYIDPNSSWYNENIHKYNYLMVYCVPKYLTDYDTNGDPNALNEARANMVQCIIEKESSYCVLSR